MTRSRREVIEAALAAAVAAATPRSLFAMAERSVPPGERFLLVTLRDQRIVAIDRMQGRKAYLLSPGPAPDGEYALSRSGSLVVRGGAIRDVQGTARSSEYSFARSGQTIEVRNAQGKTVSRVAVPAERSRS